MKDIQNNSQYHFIQNNIKNESIISNLVKDFDIVVNFAAESHVDRSISNPKPFVETNVLGTYSLLEAIRKHDKLFIHVSTDEVYGDAENGDHLLMRYLKLIQVTPTLPQKLLQII